MNPLSEDTLHTHNIHLINLVFRYYHNLVLDSFLIMFGHLVWALLSTALVFTLLGMVSVIIILCDRLLVMMVLSSSSTWP